MALDFPFELDPFQKEVLLIANLMLTYFDFVKISAHLNHLS